MEEKNKSGSEYIMISDGAQDRTKQDNGVERNLWGVCCFSQDDRERTLRGGDL